MNDLISLEEVKKKLQDPNVVVVDCRFDLADKENGKKAYALSHLPGAFYMDLEHDLSSPVQAHGGRHPLPDVQELSGKLGEIGIGQSTNVLLYDDQNGCMAARMWWLLNYYGHESVQVMEEGFSTWVKKGFPVTDELPSPSPKTFIPNVQTSWVANVNAIEDLPKDRVLVDSRAPERYRGEVEPIDPKAGHIPGALNRFWLDAVKDGRWKSTEELEKQFADIKNRSVMVYCGSGVTACANILAMKAAGVKDLTLYAGSWSDWVSYEHHPVEQGDGPQT